MAGNVEIRTVNAALEHEIRAIEEARDALPDDSHLRTLCTLAMERLGDFASQPRAIGSALWLEGQQVLPTGYIAGDVNMPLVADSIEPQ